MSARRRLYVLGLDGLDPRVADRLAAEGELPHWKRLRETSRRIELDAGKERYTGLAWEHFSTGLEPAEAARWSAVSVDAGHYSVDQPPTSLAPFTARLDARTTVFDAPYFDLQKTASAQGLVAWGAHDPGVAQSSRPEGLVAEIEARFGPYPAPEFIYGLVWPYPDETARMARAMVAAVERRNQVARWLFAERLPDWDLAIHVISEYHSAAEALWHGWDSAHPLHGHSSAEAARKGFLGVYEAADRLLGDVLADFPDADVLAFTPHGMGPNAADVPAMVLLPELLYRDATGRTGFHADPDWPADGTLEPDPGRNWYETIHGRLDVHVPRLERWRRRLRGLPPAEPSELDWMPATAYRRAWPQQDVYAVPSFYDGRIRVNLKGREALGRISLGDYEGTLRRAADLVAECRDSATGRRLALECEYRDDPLFRHPTDADLLIRFLEPSYAWDHPRLGRIGPAPCRRPGGHTGGLGVACYRSAEGGEGELGTFRTLELSSAVAALLGDENARSPLAEALRRVANPRPAAP